MRAYIYIISTVALSACSSPSFSPIPETETESDTLNIEIDALSAIAALQEEGFTITINAAEKPKPLADLLHDYWLEPKSAVIPQFLGINALGMPSGDKDDWVYRSKMSALGFAGKNSNMTLPSLDSSDFVDPSTISAAIFDEYFMDVPPALRSKMQVAPVRIAFGSMVTREIVNQLLAELKTELKGKGLTAAVEARLDKRLNTAVQDTSSMVFYYVVIAPGNAIMQAKLSTLTGFEKTRKKSGDARMIGVAGYAVSQFRRDNMGNRQELLFSELAAAISVEDPNLISAFNDIKMDFKMKWEKKFTESAAVLSKMHATSRFFPLWWRVRTT